jgi:hypothetical protein
VYLILLRITKASDALLRRLSRRSIERDAKLA